MQQLTTGQVIYGFIICVISSVIRVHFLPSSWYSTTFWIWYENNVGNALVF